MKRISSNTIIQLLVFFASLYSILSDGPNYAEHGLFWSSVPQTIPSIRTNGAWQTIPDVNLHIPLEQNSTLVFGYVATLEGLRKSFVVSPLPREGSADTIQIRCLINNIPFRVSSSYGSTYSTEERVFLKLINSFAIPLTAGKSYNVTLQWKKLGPNIAEWLIASSGLDPGLSLVAHADFESVFSLQETSDAVIGSNNMWKPLSGNLSFNLFAESPITISYAVIVQPQLNKIIKDRLMDFVTVRAVVDGVAYTESSETFGTNGWNPLASSLFASFQLKLSPGRHTVYLQWKKVGTVFQNWLSSPSFLDGFASSRNLIVTRSKIETPISFDYERRFLRPKENGRWSVVNNNTMQFTLIKQSAVLFTYGLPITQNENPNLDSFSWNELSKIEARLVIDGISYTSGSGSAMTITSRRMDSLFGQLALILPAGTHTVYLQWRSETVQWRTLNELSDGYAHGARLLTYITSENAQPSISCASRIGGFENQDIVISTLTISDIDEQLSPGMIVMFEIMIQTGTLSFPNQPTLANDIEYVHGSDFSTIVFEDTIENINAALFGMIYHPPDYWFGEDVLTFTLSDVELVGYGSAKSATNSTLVFIEAIDTPFSLDAPSQVEFTLDADHPNQPLSLPVITLSDRDNFETKFKGDFAVSCGKISLDAMNFDSEGSLFYPDEQFPSNSLSFVARTEVMKIALGHLLYIPDATCAARAHSETLLINISSLSTFQVVSKYMVITLQRPEISPEIFSKRYSRWNVQGIVSAMQKREMLNEAGTEENLDNTGYEYDVSFVDDWITQVNVTADDIVLANQGSQSNGSELIVLKNRFMEYAFSLQFNQSNLLFLKDFKHLTFGGPSSVLVEVAAASTVSTDHACELDSYSFPAIRVNGTSLFNCSFSINDEDSTSWIGKVLWLKFVWFDRNEGEPQPQRSETNYVPLYFHDSVEILEYSPQSIIGGSQSLLSMELNRNSGDIESCLFGGNLLSPAFQNGRTNVITCRIPEVAADVGSLSVRLVTSTSSSISNLIVISVKASPLITAAVIEANDVEGNYALQISGVWEDEVLDSVKFIHCIYDGYQVSPLFSAGGGSIYCPLEIGFDEIAACCASGSCLSSLKFDLYDTNAINTTCSFHLHAQQDQSVSRLYSVDMSPGGSDFLTFYDQQSLNNRSDIQNLSGAVCQFSGSRNTSLLISSDFTYSCSIPSQVGQLLAVLDSRGVNLLASSLEVGNLPTFQSLSPSHGPLNGGVFIVFSSDAAIPDGEYSCLIGKRKTRGVKVSSFSFGCYTLSEAEVGAVPIQPMFGSLVLSQSSMVFNYTAAVTVDEIFPVMGLLSRSQKITISGSGFLGLVSTEETNIHCVFGEILTPLNIVNDSSSYCMSPEYPFPRTVELFLQVPAVVNIRTGSTFTFSAGCDLLIAKPDSIYVNVSSDVKVTGAGFLLGSAIYCKFDDFLVPAVVESDTTLFCRSPLLSEAKVVMLALSNSAGDVVSVNQLPITFVAPILWTKHEPLFAIEGKTVKFHLTSETDLSVYRGSLTQVSCHLHHVEGVAIIIAWNKLTCEVAVPSPLLKQGEQAELTVQLNGLKSNYEARNMIPIYPVPVIESLQPMIGGIQSGSNVVHFSCPGCAEIVSTTEASSVRCRFDFYLTPAVLQSNNKAFACFAPIIDEFKIVPFGVLINDYVIESGWNYSFLSVPEVLRITPTKGSVARDQAVFIFGHDFPLDKDILCRFGNASTHGQILNSTTVRCIAQAVSNAGSSQIGLLIEGLEINSNFYYEHVPQPQITSFGPTWTIVSTLRTFFLGGVGFDRSDTYTCRFDTKDQVVAQYVSNSSLQCQIMLPDVGETNLHVFSALHGSIYRTVVDVLPQVKVQTLSKSSGSIDGGELILASVIRFDECVNQSNLQCSFGGLVTAATVRTMNTIGCLAPKILAEGVVNFNLVIDGLIINENTVTYDYSADITVFDFSPKRISYGDGSVVDVVGSNLCSEPLLCVFGNLTTLPMNNGCQKVSCLPPQMLPEGTYFFGLEKLGRQFLFDEKIEVVSSIKIVDVSPSFLVASSPGTLVTVSLSSPVSVESEVACVVGVESYSAIIDENGYNVTCLFTDPPLGKVPLGVDIDGIVYMDEAVQLNVIAAPLVTAVSSLVLPVNSNNALIVKGKNFLQELVFTCNLGDDVIVQGEFVDGDLLCNFTGVVENVGEFPLSLGMSSFIERIPTPFSVTVTSELSVLAATKDKLYESSSSSLGIYGHNFVSGASYECSLNKVTFKARWLSLNLLECYLTDLTAGNYGVSVLMNGLSFGSNVTIQILPMGVIDFISPSSGYEAGGATVLVRGRSFVEADDIVCIFDGVDTLGSFVNSSLLLCRSPPYYEGDVSFKVKIGEHFLHFNSSSGSQFQYFANPKFVSAFPTVLPYEGGVSLTIRGSSFITNHPLECVFNGSVMSLASISASNQATCVSPTFDTSGEVTLSLKFGPDSFTETVTILVSDLIVVTGASERGVEEGNYTELLVRGINFPKSVDTWCVFGQSSFIGYVLDSNSLICRVHSSDEDLSLKLQLNFGGLLFSSDFPSFKTFRSMLYEISSNVIPNSHSITLYVKGTGFSPYNSPKCWFGPIFTEAAVINETLIKCETPLVTWTGSVKFALEVLGGEVGVQSRQSFDLEFVSPPNVRAISLKQLTESAAVFLITGSNLNCTKLEATCSIFSGSVFSNTSWIASSSDSAECVVPMQGAQTVLNGPFLNDDRLVIGLLGGDLVIYEEKLSSFPLSLYGHSISLSKNYGPQDLSQRLQFSLNTTLLPTDIKLLFRSREYDLTLISEVIAQSIIETGISSNAPETITVVSASLGALKSFPFTVLPEVRVKNISISQESFDDQNSEDGVEYSEFAEVFATLAGWDTLSWVNDLSIEWFCAVGNFSFPAFVVDELNHLYCQVSKLALCETGNLQIGYDEVIMSEPFFLDDVEVCRGLINYPYLPQWIDSPFSIYENDSQYYQIAQELQSLSANYRHFDFFSEDNFSFNGTEFVDSSIEDLYVYGIDVSSQSNLLSNFLTAKCEINKTSCLQLYDSSASSNLVPAPFPDFQDVDMTLLPFAPLLTDSVSPKIVGDYNETWVTIQGRNFDYQTQCALLAKNMTLPTVVLSSMTVSCLVPGLNVTKTLVLTITLISRTNKSQIESVLSQSAYASVQVVYQLGYNQRFNDKDFSHLTSTFIANDLEVGSKTALVQSLCLSKIGCDVSLFPAVVQTSTVSSQLWEQMLLERNHSNTSASATVEEGNSTASTSYSSSDNKSLNVEILAVYPDHCSFPCENVWIRFLGYGWMEAVNRAQEGEFVMNVNGVLNGCQYSYQDSSSLYCPLPQYLPPSNYSLQLLSSPPVLLYESSFTVMLDREMEEGFDGILTADPSSVLIPMIEFIAPTFSWLSGGGVLKMYGKNVSDNLAHCLFQIGPDGVNEQDATRNSFTNVTIDVVNQIISCRVPSVSSARKRVKLSLITFEGSMIAVDHRFAFYPDPIYHLVRWSQHINDSIEVFGSGFSPFRQAFCKLYHADQTTYLVSAIVYSDKELICEHVPFLLRKWNNRVIAVSLSFNGIDFSSSLKIDIPSSLHIAQRENVIESETVAEVLEVSDSLHSYNLTLPSMNLPSITLNCSQVNYVPFQLDGLTIDPDYTCLLDDSTETVTIGSLILPNQRFCIVESLTPGTHEVTLVSRHSYHASLRQVVICEPEPFISSISVLPPTNLNRLSSSRFTTFVFLGYNFQTKLKLNCRLNNEVVNVAVDNNRKIFCSYPNVLMGYSYNLSVFYGQKSLVEINFCFTEDLSTQGGAIVQRSAFSQCLGGTPSNNHSRFAPIKAHDFGAVRFVYPSSGTSSGNTMVKIIADRINYEEAINCIFDGGLIVPALVAGNDYVLCPSPPHSVGNVTIALQTVDGAKEWCCGNYYYHPYLVLESIEPSSISGLEDALIIITVGNPMFAKDRLSILYCHVNKRVVPASYSDVKNGRFSCILPALYESVASISLGSSEEPWSNVLQVPILRSAKLFSMAPNFGSLFGGTPMTITLPTDVHLSATPVCVFDGSLFVEGKYAFPQNKSVIICITPSYGSTVKTMVELKDGNSSIASPYYMGEYQFDYLAQSASLLPTASPRTTPLLLVKVFGANFRDSAQLSCLIFADAESSKAIASLPATWLSMSFVTCGIPAIYLARDAIYVQVSNNGIDRQPLSLRVNLTEEILIASYEPLRGFTVGGNEIYINLRYAISVELFCEFDGLKLPSYQFNATFVICTAPSHLFGSIRMNLLDQEGTVYDSLLYEYEEVPVLRLASNVAINRGKVSTIKFVGSEISQSLEGVVVDLEGNTVSSDCQAFIELDGDYSFICDNILYTNDDDYLILSITNNGLYYLDNVTAIPVFTPSTVLWTDPLFMLENGNAGFISVAFDFISPSSATTCVFGVADEELYVLPEVVGAAVVHCALPAFEGIIGKPVSFALQQYGNRIFGANAMTVISPPEIERIYPVTFVQGLAQQVQITFMNPIGHFPTLQVHFNDKIYNLTRWNNTVYVTTITPTEGGVQPFRLLLKEIPSYRSEREKYVTIINISQDIIVNANTIVAGASSNLSFISQECRFGALIGTLPSPRLSCQLNPGECNVVSVESCEVKVSVRASLGVDFADVSLCLDEYCSPMLFSHEITVLPTVSIVWTQPSIGSISGGSLINVYGFGFVMDGTLSCVFGSTSSPAFVVSTSLVQCQLPASTAIGKVTVHLERKGVIISESIAFFQYIPLISQILVDQEAVSMSGGTKLQIQTQALAINDTLECRFNEKRTLAVILNSTTITCLSPPLDVAKVDLAIAYGGSDISVAFPLLVQEELHSLFIDPVTFIANTPVNVSVFFDQMPRSRFRCEVDGISYAVQVAQGSAIVCLIDSGLAKGSMHALQLFSNDLLIFEYSLAATSPFEIFNVFPLDGYSTQSMAIDIMTTADLISENDEDVSCCFGSIRSPAILISAEQWRCYTPTFDFGGVQQVYELAVGLALGDQGFCEYSGFTVTLYTPVEITGQSRENGSTVNVEAIELYTEWNYTPNNIYCRIGASVTIGQVLPKSILCMTEPTLPGVFSIDLSMNGLNFLQSGAYFEFVSPQPISLDSPILIPVPMQPLIYYLSQTSFPAANEMSVDVFGINYDPESLCLLNGIRILDTNFVDSTHVRCTFPVLTAGNAVLSIVNGDPLYSNEIAITFTGTPRISSISRNIFPSYGPRRSSTIVQIEMEDLLAYEGNVIYCLTGDQWSLAFDITNSSVSCTVPPGTALGSVKVQIGTANREVFPGESYFRYIDDPLVFDIQPKYGTAFTNLMVIGKGFSKFPSLSIQYGDVPSLCNILSDSRLICKVPPKMLADEYLVSLQTNGQHLVMSGLFFNYYSPVELLNLWPMNGPAMRGGTVVSINGSYFPDSQDLYCIVDTAKVLAEYINSTMIRCRTPPHKPGMVNIAVALDGVLLHTFDRALNFLYTPDVSVDLISPNVGYTAGEFPIFVYGSNFLNTTALGCQFADMKSRGIFLSNTTLICLLPSPLGRSALYDLSNVAVEVTVNGYDYSDSGVLFSYSQPCDQGFFCPGLNRQLCPNGTYCPENSRNFTLCPPGTFQPLQGQTGCVTCPVGYLCPDLGMPRPIVCPPGLICDIMGLQESTKLCPAGMYCLNGTKSSNVDEFNGSEWIEDYVTGVKYFNASSQDWSYTQWPYPAVGESRPNAPPESSCDGLVCSGGTNNFLAEAPFPCPIGHYCRAGVGTQIPMPKNFSSPQRCFDGFFCPRGSVHPEGGGPCPNGYFCPTQLDAIICPPGHYCPGVGNTNPVECYPGTYNPFPGQANCTVCPSGYICPGWGLLLPETCPQGFVCMSLGLSYPVAVCPQGYRCGEGTRTLDPSDSTPYRPVVCGEGKFCLGGVFSLQVVPWIAASPYGVTHPQECSEGTYCESGAYLPSGSGLCFVGHYCPPNSSFPTEVPVGNFASGLGSVAATLCYPGTYAPLNASVTCDACPSGHTCVSYGTYIPTICVTGTYRSQVDSVTCTSCPTGTYSYETGSPDLSLCLPCPKGRICPSKKLVTLASSISCPDGYICGYATDRSSQFSHLTPAGFHTAAGSSPDEQYDSYCAAGYYCARGTPTYLQYGGKCTVGYFCPKSSPASIISDNACPVLTTSLSQSSTILNCTINPVEVCDKNFIDATDPMDDVTYYSSFTYDALDGTGSITLDSSLSAVNPTGELQVPIKVHPVNISASSPGFLNDTIEAFRTCPLYGSGDGGDVVMIIGRNFIDNKLNYCKFRACFFSNRGRHLRRCKNQIKAPSGADLPKVGNVSEQTFITRARWISSTRMECETPKFLFNYDFNATFETNKYECQYLDAFGNLATSTTGNLSYVRTCFSTSDCANKPSKGYEFYITLTLPCSTQDTVDGVCSNMPELGYMFNPCMSGEAVVEVTNDGETYSGGVELQGTSILSTVRFGDGGPIYNDFKNYTINSTFAVFTYVYPEYFYTNPSIMEMERKYCQLPRYSEEAPRKREEGWFRLQAHELAMLSFDFTNIPSDVIYDQHYRIALFAIPSRCTAQLCSSARVRLSPQEYVPCVSPMPLSYWFQNMGIYNVVNNLTVYALDDMLFKVEIHVLYGLFVPMAPLFVNSTTVVIASPSRVKSQHGVNGDNKISRQLTKYVSFEQKTVEMQFIWVAVVYQTDSSSVSPPLNLPPLYSAYKNGRALIMNNVSANNPNVPLVLDVLANVQPGVEFWYAPASTPDESKELLDAYFETFQDTTYDPVLGYSFNFDTLVIPYFPYFSNCYTFDSYIPIWFATEGKECALPDGYPRKWHRYKYPALPDQDDINYAGPFDFFADPLSEWCNREIICNYEEDLSGQDSTPRWFEYSDGSTLFNLIRYPAGYFDYTGRKGIGISTDDAGGGAFAQDLAAESSDNFIPVAINRSLAEDTCSLNCFPRSYELLIQYYQEDLYSKRIIIASLNEALFDTNADDTSYTLRLSYSPLSFLDLIMNFAYPLSIFVVIFIFSGMTTISLAFLGWIMTRVFTTLQNPPQLRITSMLPLLVPPAVFGVYLAVLLIWFMTSMGNLFINGFFYTNPNTPEESPLGAQWLDNYPLTYNALETPVLITAMQNARYGRVGAMFFIIGFLCFFGASRLFFPRDESKREKEMAEKRTPLAKKEDLWNPMLWKKLNLVLWSFVLATLLVIPVEITIFWPDYGDYFYQVIVMMFVLAEVKNELLGYFLADSLLEAPVGSSWNFIQNLMGFGAPNFYQFVLSNLFDFVVTSFQRVYQGSYIDIISDAISAVADYVTDLIQEYVPKYLNPLKANEADDSIPDHSKDFRRRAVEGIGGEDEDDSESVEPIIEYIADIGGDTTSVLYFPYFVYLLMLYRTAILIPEEYGIRQSDMVIYMVYQLFLIIFQPIVDCLNHSQVELFHGLKVYEYLVYCRYRFLQREARWKGMEITLDECIEEGLRRLDQMCFSSQYFFMITIQLNGMIYVILAYEVWLRYNYSIFSDAGFFPLVGFLLACYIGLEFFIFYVAKHFGIWKIKHEGTAWHIIQKGEETELEVPAWEEIKGASSEVFLMNQRITSETFRYKFLNYNRTWLINQLPNILTPRTLRRSRPYLINQFARILNARRDDISDEESEDEKEKKFGPIALTTSSRNIIRHWLGQARRRLKLRSTVEPIIKRARGAQCEQCLSRKQLHTEYEVDLDAMITMYDRTYPGDEEVDQVQWKTFWVNNQRYHTICLACMTQRKAAEAMKKIKGGNIFDPTLFDDDDDQEKYPEWGPVFLSGSSKAILLNWYRKAQKLRAGKKQRRQRREKVVRDISDDEGDDPMFSWLKEGLKEITPASKAIALKWMRTARARLQQKRGKGAGLRESDVAEDAIENVPETFKSGRKSKMLKK